MSDAVKRRRGCQDATRTPPGVDPTERSIDAQRGGSEPNNGERDETGAACTRVAAWRWDTAWSKIVKSLEETQRFNELMRQYDGRGISFDQAVEPAKMAPVDPSQDSRFEDFEDRLMGQLLRLEEAPDGEVLDREVLVVTQKFLVNVVFAESSIDGLLKALLAERSDGRPMLSISEEGDRIREARRRQLRNAAYDGHHPGAPDLKGFDVTFSVPRSNIPIRGTESLKWIVKRCERLARRHYLDILFAAIHLEDDFDEKPRPEPGLAPVVLVPALGVRHRPQRPRFAGVLPVGPHNLRGYRGRCGGPVGRRAA